MRLTYRGINYKYQAIETKPQPTRDRDGDYVILIYPIHCYTYRGVSYSKSVTFDTHAKLFHDSNMQ